MATIETARSSTGAATLTCPECGKTFTRPAAMGAHRSRVHGVAGTSRNTTSTRTGRTPSGSSTTANSSSRKRSSSPSGRGTSGRQRAAAASTATSSRSRSRNGGNDGVNRDALLQTLFPRGIPAKQNVIAAVNDWLEQADRLSRLR
jgi:hypothetical protein